MPKIRQTHRHQQLRNSFTPEQLRVVDKELARIRQARQIALEQGGDPQSASVGTVGERDPNVGTGDQQPIGTETVDDQDPSTRANSLQAPATEEGTQNPTNEWESEEKATTHPTSTTTTTANSTFNSTSITSTGPTTITSTLNLTGAIPNTTTTITMTGVTKITTDTTPFITIDTDTEEESAKEPNSKHQKTDHSEDTGMDYESN